MEPPSALKCGRSDSDSENEEPSPKRMKKDDENGGNGNENEENKDIKNRENEENHFLRLFTYILDIIMLTKGISESCVSDALFKLKSSFPNNFEEFKFSDWENICAYLYRLGSHGAGLARYRVLRAIRECEAVETTFKKSDLRIICLASGPGNDVVGLCSALSELQCPTHLKLTAVDKFKEWSLCVKLVKLLLEEDEFGKASELFQKTKVDLSFVQANLPDSSNEEYLQALREADVILMSKFITFKDPDFKANLIQSLLDNMKDEALILHIDTCYASDWISFERVYGFFCGEDDYQSNARATPRFEYYDSAISTLPINVMRKKIS